MNASSPSSPRGRRSRRVAAAVLAVSALFVLSGGPFGAAPVADAAATHPALDCSGQGSWQGSNISLGVSSCQAGFGGQYGTWDSNGGYFLPGAYNFSYSVRSIAEITPGGAVVRIASGLAPETGTASVVNASGRLEMTAAYVTNVTTGNGTWNPSNTVFAANGNGGGWDPGQAVLGQTTLTMDWNLSLQSGNGTNGTPAPIRMKFDVGVGGWPWASPDDHLGLELSGLAAWGAHFAWEANGSFPDTLVQVVNPANGTVSANASASNGTGNVSGLAGAGNGSAWAIGLELGANASASGGGRLSVGVWPGFYAGGTPDRVADLLVNFTGSSGGYANLSYDPWMLFTPLAIPTGGQGGSSHPGAGVVGGDVIDLGGAIVVALAAVAVAAIAVRRARRTPPEAGLTGPFGAGRIDPAEPR